MKEANYTKPADDWADLMTVEEFKQCVKQGGFIDYDGSGHPVKDGMQDSSFHIYPSQIDQIPADATHINWYNR